MMPQVLCCICGVLIEPNAANTCSTCLASKSDITRGISTEATLHQCRGCGRWHKEAGKWMACDLESRELMALCLNHVSGLHNKQQQHGGQRIRLVDAGWIWTEPHSMRLKVRLTVQREVQAGTILQQSFTVNYTVRNQQCTECQAEFRQGSWKSLVQVRQRVSHKRTFLYLEQLILKHGAHRGCLSIETFRDGMDFYFPDKGKAARFLAFLENVCPIKVKTSKKLISTDVKSNISNFKYTSLAEICPLCKDDLLYLPTKLARSMGNIAQLVMVKNISDVIHLIDPQTGQTAQMTSEVFWREEPIRPIITAARARMTRYVVLGKEAVFLRKNVSQRVPSRKQKSRLASLVVAREQDMGVINDCQYEERSHVGYLMKAGDVLVGYDLKDTNLADDDAETARREGKFPDFVAIRKLYGGAAATTNGASTKNRIWRLQRLDVKAGEEETTGGRGSKNKRNAADLNEMDEEDFMQEVEADKEMRLNMNLYKATDTNEKEKADEELGVVDMDDGTKEEDEEDDDDDQQVRLDELLDSLALDDGADKQEQQQQEGNNDGLEELVYEEGERAAKDGLKYVSRQDVRNLQERGAASVVVTGGADQHAKDFDVSL